MTILNPFVSFPAAGGAFSPLDLPDLAGWYDASQVSGTDSVAVTTWPDESGNSRDLTATTGPTFIADAQNGLPALRFPGSSSDELMTRADSLGISAQPLTTIVAIKLNSTGFGGVINFGPWNTSLAGLNAAPYTRGDWRIFFGSLVNTSTSFGTSPVVIGSVIDGASSALRINGTSAATGNANTRAPDTPFTVGGALNDLTEMDAYEIIVCGSKLGSSDLADAETYLIDKWGL